MVYELVLGTLPAEVKGAYYEETKRFARLFGIPEAILPANWDAFRAYVERMLASDTLTVTPEASLIGRFLFKPPHPLLAGPTRRSELLTAWLLPPRLAEGFGLDHGGAEGQARFARTVGQLRWLFPKLPRRLRYLPPYVEARRRLAGNTGRDPIGELLTRLFVGDHR